jgi:cytochrome c-type biogenesis protein CcsB
MNNIEIILFWATVFLYAGSFCTQLFPTVRGKEIKGLFLKLLALGFAFHVTTYAARWMAGDHLPVNDVYELNLTGTLLATFLFLLFYRLKKLVSQVALVSTPVCFILLGYGWMSRTDAYPSSPAYDSPWLVLHVLFAWLAFGSFLIAVGASVFYLLKKRNPESKRLGKLPSLEALDDMNYQYVILGFINHAIMLLAGTFWAKKLWGHYWSWDPLETWALITFLFYVFFLHTRRFFGWKGSKSAWMAIAGIFILTISFWGVSLVSPAHLMTQ